MLVMRNANAILGALWPAYQPTYNYGASFSHTRVNYRYRHHIRPEGISASQLSHDPRPGNQRHLDDPP